jgi:hypothetical protein
MVTLLGLGAGNNPVNLPIDRLPGNGSPSQDFSCKIFKSTNWQGVD